MDEPLKLSRTLLYQYYNFGGITDWAVDLQSFSDAEFMTDDTYAQRMVSGGSCPWKNPEGYHCDARASTDTTLTGETRWYETACDCAWGDFLVWWEKELDKDRHNSFSSSAASISGRPKATGYAKMLKRVAKMTACPAQKSTYPT